MRRAKCLVVILQNEDCRAVKSDRHTKLIAEIVKSKLKSNYTKWDENHQLLLHTENIHQKNL